MKKQYYLAYGSNLDIDQMAWRCPTAQAVGVAVLKDWQLLFRGSKSGSYLTIERKKGFEVPVGVWEIQPIDEAALDRYEGYPDFYYKKTLPVVMEDFAGKLHEVDALVYIMHEDRPLGVPSGAYVRICAKGYNDFGFDLETLTAAVKASVERCRKETYGESV